MPGLIEEVGGEGANISPPALLFLFVLFCLFGLFFFFFGLVFVLSGDQLARTNSTLGQDQPILAQCAEMIVDERPLTICV